VDLKKIGKDVRRKMREKPFIIACIPAYTKEKNIAKVVMKTLRRDRHSNPA